jgi:hypothetical protein
MTPTIRIDDDVHQWLQSQAIPFEDSPNSVLRRLAGLDGRPARRRSTGLRGNVVDLKAADSQTASPSPGETQRPNQPAWGEKPGEIHQRRDRIGRRAPLATGAELIRRWRIPATQARFHRDGSWYEGLERFPGAYCDCQGYVLFNSEADLRTTPGIRIEPSGQVWVPGGISGVADYQKVDDPISDPTNP